MLLIALLLDVCAVVLIQIGFLFFSFVVSKRMRCLFGICSLKQPKPNRINRSQNSLHQFFFLFVSVMGVSFWRAFRNTSSEYGAIMTNQNAIIRTKQIYYNQSSCIHTHTYTRIHGHTNEQLDLIIRNSLALLCWLCSVSICLCLSKCLFWTRSIQIERGE